MNCKIILILLIVSVYAVHDKDQRILESSHEQDENGYNFMYSSSDGQERQESGYIDQSGNNPILRITGTYSYISNDGNRFNVFYSADEYGFKPIIYSIPPSKTATISEPTKEHESQMTETPSTNKPVLNVPFIGTAAIASLAGGGLG